MRQTELDKKCFDAVSAGDVDLVAQCISAGANVNVRGESCGYLPVSIASHLGHAMVAEFLLQNGAVMDHGAQLEAVNMGHAAVLRVLLDNGADPNWSHPETGETPLHVATFRAHRTGAYECVRCLLAAGANVNSKTKNRIGSDTFDGGYVVGETPLHNAAAYGNMAMIRLLIDAGTL